MKYKKKEYYEKHRTITFTTLEKNSYYEVCSVCLLNTETDMDIFKWLSSEHTKEEFATYKKKIKGKQLYSCEDEVGEEPLLSLVTCEYSKESTRLLIIAKKVRKEIEFQKLPLQVLNYEKLSYINNHLDIDVQCE